MKGKIALNFIYLSPKHAGGKDQVGFNLLKGFCVNGAISDMCIICFDYSVEKLKSIAPKAEIIAVKAPKMKTELQRLLYICYTNTFIIPKIIKNNKISLLFHLSCNTGVRKQSVASIVLPHDIKQIAHRKLPGITVPFYKYIIYKLMYFIDFKVNDGIIAISDVDKTEIEIYYPSTAFKIRRIYNPIDASYTDEKGDSVGEDIVAVNLQFHHKNIITLIKAFELIRNKIESNLILVGDVPKRVDYLKKYVVKKRLQDRVIFTGFISKEERVALLRGSRLYVNPTLYEGFGMTAVEAMILRTPTLVSKIETNYEVTLGMCQYYEPPEDEKALAEKLLECMNKTNEDMKLREISEKVYEKYNYVTISKQYMSYFDELLLKCTKG